MLAPLRGLGGVKVAAGTSFSERAAAARKVAGEGHALSGLAFQYFALVVFLVCRVETRGFKSCMLRLSEWEGKGWAGSDLGWGREDHSL